MKLKLKKNHLLAGLLIFFLALILRLYSLPGLTAFNRDQARDLIFILEHLKNSQPILLGPKASMADFFLGPFYYQLIAPIVAIFPQSPLVPAVLVAFLDSATVLVILLIFHQFFSFFPGIIAAILYATSPLAIQFGRFAWNPNPIPFFTSLFLFFSLKFLKTNSLLDYLLTCLFCALAIHLHYQAAILLLFLAFISIVSLIKKFDLEKIFLGGLVGLVTFLPWFFYDLTHNFFNLRNIYSFFTREYELWFQGVRLPQFFITFIPRFFSRLQGFNLTISRLIFWSFLFFILFQLTLKVKHWYQLKAKRRQLLTTWSPTLAFGLFFLLSLLGLRIYKGDKLDYYMAFLYPVPAMIIGLYLHLTQKYKSAVLLLAAILLFGNLTNSPLRESLNHDIASRSQLANQIMAYYPGQSIYVLPGDASFTNPVKYFLLLKQKLALNPNHYPQIIICPPRSPLKLCSPQCSLDFTIFTNFREVDVREKIL